MDAKRFLLVLCGCLGGAPPPPALAQLAVSPANGAPTQSASGGELDSLPSPPLPLVERLPPPEPPRSPRLPGRGMGGGPMGGGNLPGYEATWYPSQSVTDQAAEFGFVRQGLNLGAPVWRSEADMLLARISVENTSFDTAAVLPDSLRDFPDELWDVNFGLNWMREFDNGWSSVVIAGFGSASDRPFHSIEEFTANLGVIVRVPVRQGRDAWQLGAMYIYGGPLTFPIPIVAYAWNPRDDLQINLGVPLAANWTPTEQLQFSLSYMPLYNINARLTYQFASAMQVFAGYEYLNESYFLADRLATEDRFFGLEQRVIAGWRWDVAAHGTLELSGGYSFGRRYGEGESQWSDLQDQIDIDPGPFVGFGLRLRF